MNFGSFFIIAVFTSSVIGYPDVEENTAMVCAVKYLWSNPPSNEWKPITFDEITLERSAFQSPLIDITNGTFQVPISGVYHISYNVGRAYTMDTINHAIVQHNFLLAIPDIFQKIDYTLTSAAGTGDSLYGSVTPISWNGYLELNENDIMRMLHITAGQSNSLGNADQITFCARLVD